MAKKAYLHSKRDLLICWHTGGMLMQTGLSSHINRSHLTLTQNCGMSVC